MKAITLRLPAGAIQRGGIYPTKRRHYLTQDMLEVELGGEIFVDVGWWPQRDPSGSFVVSVFKTDWEHQLEPQYFTKNAHDAAAKVEEWARKFWSGSLRTVSGLQEEKTAPAP